MARHDTTLSISVSLSPTDHPPSVLSSRIHQTLPPSNPLIPPHTLFRLQVHISSTGSPPLCTLQDHPRNISTTTQHTPTHKHTHTTAQDAFLQGPQNPPKVLRRPGRHEQGRQRIHGSHIPYIRGKSHTHTHTHTRRTFLSNHCQNKRLTSTLARQTVKTNTIRLQDAGPDHHHHHHRPEGL